MKKLKEIKCSEKNIKMEEAEWKPEGMQVTCPKCNHKFKYIEDSPMAIKKPFPLRLQCPLCDKNMVVK